MTHLRCTKCGNVLTTRCRRGAPDEHDPEATDRAPAVAPGAVVRLQEADARPIIRNGEVIEVKTYSLASAISQPVSKGCRGLPERR